MAKPFSELRKTLPPDAQRVAEELAKALLATLATPPAKPSCPETDYLGNCPIPPTTSAE